MIKSICRVISFGWKQATGYEHKLYVSCSFFLFQRPPPPKKVRVSSSDRDAESGSPSESEPTPSESDSGKNSDQVIAHTNTTWYDCLVV